MNSKTLRIILLGLNINSRNLGCSALGHSFLCVLDRVASELDIKMDLVSVNYASASLSGENYTLRDLPIHYKQKSFREQLAHEVKNADLTFDFTGGDSFTDIYGLKRFVKETIIKQYVISKGKPLILGPQTIGPFNKTISKQWAKRIIRKSKQVFTRDILSYDYAQKEFGIAPFLTTDIAFMLPVEETKETFPDTDNKVGINVSGLLWHGGYTGKNELGINLDYKALVEKYIEHLIQNGWNVWLIPHVMPDNASSPENDYQPMEELKVKYPQVELAPRFRTPMEAKGFISNMDFFVGSRMHATVAAFSTGVPTVSVAYSRKFQGLYNSVGYPYVIDAKTATTEQALHQLIEWTNQNAMLRDNVDSSMKVVMEKNEEFLSEIKLLIKSASER